MADFNGMITIPVEVCGDVWANPSEVIAKLDSTNIGEPVALDLKAEGPSLEALGILQEIKNHCAKSGRDPGTLRLVNAPNNREKTFLTNNHTGISHFFTMSVRYWEPVRDICEHANRFAMFVGRATIARCAIMYRIMHNRDIRDHFKFSTMQDSDPLIWSQSSQRVAERIEDWFDPEDAEKMKTWWQTQRPASVDASWVQDQYDPGQNTNLDLLEIYGQFNIELVCETYTLGNTFFPTEKTVRPIMAAKPMLVYASPGYLREFRALGFRTWDSIWDESYDDFQGPDRWYRMRSVIKQLCAIDHLQFSEMMFKARDIAMHNRKHLADLVLTDRAHALAQTSIK